ncbi:PepSY-like domain-containing protein [Winogradskyella vidalii]|uniref:PepSY-like domain-containing protein n=1 Tax=Winogradskyella vidalii TaxID=2615024 RepID=UPI0015CD896D|nr:PepSY-like domain-containing protein [Winogradskyella vidalii]
MKKLVFLTLSIFAFSFSSCSDDDNDDDLNASQVPTEVSTAFEAQFPNAADVEYELFNNEYIVDFEIDFVDYEALYDSEGNLIKYKYDILNSEVPEAISTTISNDYDNRPIDDAEILVIDTINYYLIEIDNTPADDKLVFNEDGTINTTVIYWD